MEKHPKIDDLEEESKEGLPQMEEKISGLEEIKIEDDSILEKYKKDVLELNVDKEEFPEFIPFTKLKPS